MLSTIEDIHRLHALNGWSGVGYHYYVRKDGTIYRGRPEHLEGAHTKGFNHDSLGICLEGNFELEHPTAEQIVATWELLRDIRTRFGDIDLCEHRELAQTACPGRFFAEFWSNVASDLVDALVDSANSSDSPSSWAFEACAWAVNSGLVRGNGNGTYGWKTPVTLEQMTVILQRMYALAIGADSH
jgi:hypothetical protein